MGENTQRTETENQKKETETLVFPSKLRSEADGGAAHVRFQAIDADGIGPTVHLFVPQGFSVPDAAAYTTMDLGTVGALAGVSEGELTAADATAKLAMAGGLLDMKSGGVSLGLGAATGGFKALREGIASNPYTETQFTNSNIRSFGFTFKLVSETEEESDTALAIENFFRENMYPEVAGAVALRYPNKFKINFYNGGTPNKFMPRIAECYLATFNTTYNSTGNSFHKGGQPVEIDIACTFQETKALTRKDLYPDEDSGESEVPSGDE